MNNTFRKLLAMALCLALAVALLPAIAFESEAATGDISPEGIVLFEDEFNYTSVSDAIAGGWTDTHSLGRYMSFKDGCMVIDAKSNEASGVYLDYFFSGMGIPYTYSTIPVSIRFDFVVSAAKRSYQIQVLELKDSAGTTLNSALYTLDGALSNINKTTSEEFETLSVTVNAATYNKGDFLDQFKLRVGARQNSTDASVTATGTDYVKIDSVKITLLAPTGSSFQASRLQGYLANKTAYAVLPSDVAIDGSLTLGENAVLDLNGHKLTATSVQGGTNAQIIDSSADRSGMIETLDLQLDNANNPQLPLWTGSGYIFTEPKLNEEDVKRAIMSDVSDNGFTLDFRPGFGEDIRTNYLAGGNSGITMSANLSWTDMDGVDGSLDAPLSATEIFNGMYESATHRGRLILTGAKDYQQIALTLTLSSCGVVKTFDPIVFGKTVHFNADFETGSLKDNYYYAAAGNIYYRSADCAIVTKQNGDAADNKAIKLYTTNDLNFAENIVTGAGKKLVIEFDLLTLEGKDSFTFRHKKTGVADGGYVHYLHSKNLDGNAYFYRGASMTENLSAANVFTKVRMEIDLENGQYVLSYNGQKFSDAYKLAPAFFDNQKMTYLYFADGTIEHYFDNILIYTVGDMS